MYFRTAANAIAEPLCEILNRSITECRFPSAWKIAKVVPVHKGSARSDRNNYRPISLLCVMSKVLERHVYNHIHYNLQRYQLLIGNQSGARTGHSCQTCLTGLVARWYQAMNNGSVTGCVTVDMKKAYDLVDINVLLKKLEVYGFSEGTISWFRSYLQERCLQVVGTNNTKSKCCRIKYGVPQGSILGSTLFLLHINDLLLHVENSLVDLYVEDTTFSYSCDTLKPAFSLIEILRMRLNGVMSTGSL